MSAAFSMRDEVRAAICIHSARGESEVPTNDGPMSIPHLKLGLPQAAGMGTLRSIPEYWSLAVYKKGRTTARLSLAPFGLGSTGAHRGAEGAGTWAPG